jgi:hypothetical protein
MSFDRRVKYLDKSMPIIFVVVFMVSLPPNPNPKYCNCTDRESEFPDIYKHKLWFHDQVSL